MGDLYWGDNLDILRGYVASDSVDLIYLRVLSSRASAKHLPTLDATRTQERSFGCGLRMTNQPGGCRPHPLSC